ncbi:hypothetical protein KUTeg_004099 [Tegillarca granosa]|uniref:IRF tryptophan pentad repeat domain-containing protein n=1 Tax=Tegillarca granosa TaxID=220873 RepID=A0ABQ9FP04_TEGGR|nr:hypothetical protein KUTeg_004099 [Tegillarca granosa]
MLALDTKNNPGRKMVNKRHAPSPRKPIRPIERQKMRPWLKDRLNDGDVLGLDWHNKSCNTFKVSWRHAARQGWSSDKDADLCALNSLPDVRELSHLSVRRGNNAYKIYQFCAEKKSKRPRADSASEDEVVPAVKTTRRMPVRASRPKSYKDIEEDMDDSSSCSDGSIGSESPARTELSNSGSDCESFVEDGNKLEPTDLPDFEKICDKSDYESLKPLLYTDKRKCDKNIILSFEQLLCLTRQQEVPPEAEDESASSTSGSMTEDMDEEIVDMILDSESEIHSPTTPSEVVDGYLNNILIWADDSIDVDTFYHHEEVITSQAVILTETPKVKTEQIFGPQQTEYTSLTVL